MIKKRFHRFEQVVVHSRGIFPAKFVNALRPHQDKDEFKYIKSIYQPVTEAGINRGIDSLHVILSAADKKIVDMGDTQTNFKIRNQLCFTLR